MLDKDQEISYSNYLESLKIGSKDNCLLATAIILISLYAKGLIDKDKECLILNEIKTNIKDIISIQINLEYAPSYSITSIVDEKVNHPSHYNQGSIEVIDYLTFTNLTRDFCTGSIIKYLSRYKYKGEAIKDLKKALWYTEYLIKQLY
jgi:hypothetical protein